MKHIIGLQKYRDAFGDERGRYCQTDDGGLCIGHVEIVNGKTGQLRYVHECDLGALLEWAHREFGNASALIFPSSRKAS